MFISLPSSSFRGLKIALVRRMVEDVNGRAPHAALLGYTGPGKDPHDIADGGMLGSRKSRTCSGLV